jgi:hypothetical protein
MLITIALILSILKMLHLEKMSRDQLPLAQQSRSSIASSVLQQAATTDTAQATDEAQTSGRVMTMEAATVT